MLKCKEKSYIVIIKEDLSEWVKVWVLMQTTSVAVVKFLWKNIIIKYNIFKKLVCNNRSENKK